MDFSQQLDHYLAKLIEQPTVSSINSSLCHDPQPLLQQVQAWGIEVGGYAEIIPNQLRSDNPALIVRFGPEQDPAVTLAGHLDTVPALEHLWEASPWSYRVKDNLRIGLGVSDMKGFFAASMVVAEELKDQLKRPLQILATTDEESGMEGIQNLANFSRLPRGLVILGEPTSLQPRFGNKGVFAFQVSLQGVSGHASQVNPSSAAALVLEAVLRELRELREELQTQFTDTRFSPDHPTLNIGKIQGGDIFNRIAPEVVLEGELRLLPGMQVDVVHDQLIQRLKLVEARTEIQIELTVIGSIPPYLAGQKVQAALKITNPEVVPFASEAGFFPNQGENVVVWGPGELGQAHQPNESIDIIKLNEYTNALIAFVKEQCC